MMLPELHEVSRKEKKKVVAKDKARVVELV